RDFDALVAQLRPRRVEDAGRESGGGREGLHEQQIGNDLPVDRDAERCELLAKGRVETGFDLRVALRLDVRIAELQRGELPELTPDHLSAVDYVARSKQGRVAGLTPGRAQLHLVDAGERLHEPVGRCRF